MGVSSMITNQQKVRLVSGLAVFAVLAVLSLVGIGTTIHGWAETQASLDHWCAKAAAGAAEPSSSFPGETPSQRVRSLEAELEEVPERLVPMVLVLALSVVFLVLGVRAWRKGPRAPAGGT